MRSTLLLVLSFGLIPQLNACRTEYDCQRFSTPRILSGERFSTPLQRGLELKLHPEYDAGDVAAYGGQAWHIVVGPAGRSDADYLWAVSGNVATSRHRFIGPAFGWTAEESLRLTPRVLRFVLDDQAAAKADALYKQIVATSDPHEAERERLGRGRLTVDIAGSSHTGAQIEWIQLTGESCLPMSP